MHNKIHTFLERYACKHSLPLLPLTCLAVNDRSIDRSKFSSLSEPTAMKVFHSVLPYAARSSGARMCCMVVTRFGFAMESTHTDAFYKRLNLTCIFYSTIGHKKLKGRVLTRYFSTASQNHIFSYDMRCSKKRRKGKAILRTQVNMQSLWTQERDRDRDR